MKQLACGVLELKLEFNDCHSAAIAQSQLGILLTEVGRAGEAIPFSLDALAARRQTTRQWSQLDLQWLKRQRRLVGDDTFATVAAGHSNQNLLLDELVPLLSQVDEPT